MEKVTMAAKARSEAGKKSAKAVRNRGGIPAILYGHGMKPLSLEINEREFIHVLHSDAGENAVISLDVEGVKLKESTCLIKDVQHDPVSDNVQHVDFTVISLTEKIQVNVHLVAANGDEALGVKEGGVLDVVHHELPIECLPTQIPENISHDVKEMAINDSVHVKDLAFPDGVVCTLPEDEVVIALHPPRVEEEATPEEGEGAAEPEVIEKGKKEDVEAEGGSAEPKPAAEKKE